MNLLHSSTLAIASFTCKYLEACYRLQDLLSDRALNMGLAAQALALAKGGSSSTASQHHDKIAVTEVRRFAGKDVLVDLFTTPSPTKHNHACHDANVLPRWGALTCCLSCHDLKLKESQVVPGHCSISGP